MKRGASVPVIIIKVTGAELTGSYTLSVKADAGAAEWSAAKTGELSGDSVVAYFTKPGAEPFFVDVVSGAWYESAVRYAAEAGLMAGTGDGRFSPEVTTTRGMIVTILHRMETGVSDQGTPSPGSRWPPSFTATPAARAAMCQLGQICPPMRMQRRSAPMPWAYAVGLCRRPHQRDRSRCPEARRWGDPGPGGRHSGALLHRCGLTTDNASPDAETAPDRAQRGPGPSFSMRAPVHFFRQTAAQAGVLLCKQAAKNFHTICKKETALKRVLSNLLSAVSLLRFKAVFSCGFRVPPGSGLYQSCAAGSVCIPAGQKYCSPRPRKSCPADRKTLGLPSRCIGHRW